MENREVVSVLNELIETTKNGQAGFEQCAENAESAEVKTMFTEAANRCAQGAGELQQLVTKYGGTAETSGTAAGAIHRGWVGLKTTFTSNDDLAVLEEAEKGEDVAKKKYAECMRNDLPEDVRQIVQRQYDGVLQNHDRVKAMRDRLRASR